MHGVLPATRAASSELPAQAGSEKTSTAHSGIDEQNGWFSGPCHALLGSDPGLALSFLARIPERTAYRYAQGERFPPGFVIRTLLRSDGGWQWLSALMEGSNATWWRDLQRARRIAEAISGIE